MTADPTQFTSYLANPTDPSFVARDVDLNGWERGHGLFTMDPDTVDLGAPGLDGSWLSEAGVDDDVLATYRRGRVESSFALRIIGDGAVSYEDVRQAVIGLNRALDRFGVWVLQPPGQVDALYIDYFPSPLVSQLQPGSRSLYTLFKMLTSPSGMAVTIVRRPKFRGPMLVAEANLVHNGTLAEDHDADGVPSLWTWSSSAGVVYAFTWAYGAYSVTASTAVAAGVRWLYQVLPAGIAEGQSYTLAFDLASIADASRMPLGRLDWLDGGGALIGSSVYGGVPAGIVGPRQAFVRSVLTAAAPAGAVGVRFGLEFAAASAGNPIYVRAVQLEVGGSPSMFRPGPEVISNDPTAAFGKRLWGWGNGNTDSLARIRSAPDAPGLVRLGYARRSGPRDSAMAMRIAPGWRAVNSTALLSGSTNVADAGAAGGHAVKAVGLANDLMKPLIRQEIIQPEQSALAGTWRLQGAIRGDLGDAYLIAGRYGLGDVADLPRPMPVRRLDLTSPPTASQFYVMDLGLFDVPADSDGWFFELWAARDGASGGPGTGVVYLAELWAEPADDGLSASAVVPGTFDPGGSYTEKLPGKRMATPPDAGGPNDPVHGWVMLAGSVYGAGMLLNDAHETASIPAAMTAALSAVEHTFAFDMTLFTKSAARTKHGELIAFDLTANATIQAFGIYNPDGAAWAPVSLSVKFTPIAGHAVLVYVVDTVINAVGNIRVDGWTHSFRTPPVPGVIQEVHIEADQRRAYVLAGSAFAADLELTPPFPLLEPGLQLYRIASADVGPPGSDVAVDGETGVRHVPGRLLSTAIDSIPRWTS